MTDPNQKQLGNTLWSIADPLRGVKDTEFDIFHGDTLLNEWDMMREQNPAKKPSFDAIVANPPFSHRWDPSESMADDVRWQFGVPRKGNGNFAWVQHFIHPLAPQGMAGLNAVRQDLANGSMSSNQSGDCNARPRFAKRTASNRQQTCGGLGKATARREWATNSQSLGSQRDIRRALIEADLVDCMVALLGQLFYSTLFGKN